MAATVEGAAKPPLLVLKVGTSSLMVSDSYGQRVQLTNIARLVELIALLKRKGYQVVLICSGAVGMGCIKLGLKQKPSSLRTKQAVAAAGQSQLMRMLEDLFSTVQVKVAQLLLSQSDFMDKSHWSNIKHTILECLRLGLVPVLNENDTTNTEELRFGDNDNLAALTAVQLAADGLFLFTDVDYLYTSNPRVDPEARPLRIVSEPWALKVDTQAAGSGLGTGGMATKIVAARTASTAGIPCGLINGQNPERLLTFLDYGIIATSPSTVAQSDPGDAAAAVVAAVSAMGAPVVSAEPPLPEGTYFVAMKSDKDVGETRRWILSLPIAGEMIVDDGAAKAMGNGKSLLPAGIKKISGGFFRYECVKVIHRGHEIGRAIVNFKCEELQKIASKSSSEFEDILGYAVCVEACYRSNIILTVERETLRGLDVPTRLRSARRPSEASEGSVSSAASNPRSLPRSMSR